MREIQHYERFLYQHDLRSLYYMAPLENASLMLCHGILPFSQMATIPHRSLASSAVQHRREYLIPCSGRLLHEYVPLYIATHTAMQWRITRGTRSRRPLILPAELAIIELSARKVFGLAGVVFSDGNAASSRTQFFRDTAQLGRLNWDIIRNPRLLFGTIPLAKGRRGAGS